MPSMQEVWSISQSAIAQAHKLYPVEVVSFVLMSNHYHLLVRTPQANIDQFMYELNKRLSLMIREKSNIKNHLFGGRYKWSLIKNHQYLANCYRYIYQNPIRAGIVSRVEDYPFSSLYSITKLSDFSVPIHDMFGFKDRYTLNWLNESLSDDEKNRVKKELSAPKGRPLKKR